MWQSFDKTFLSLDSTYLRISIIVWLIFIVLVFFSRPIVIFDGFEKLAAFFCMFGLYVFTSIFYMTKAYRFNVGDSWGDVGPIGDLIGGTTVAFFTLASLILLVGTIRIQRKEMQETNTTMHLQQVEQTYFEALSSLMETRDSLLSLSLLSSDGKVPKKIKSNPFCAPWLDNSYYQPNAYSINYHEVEPNDLNTLNVLQYTNARIYQLLFLYDIAWKQSKYFTIYKLNSWFDVMLIDHFREKIHEAIYMNYSEICDLIEEYDNDLEQVQNDKENVCKSVVYSYFEESFDDLHEELVYRCFLISCHLIKITGSEETTLSIIKLMHHDVELYLIKNKFSSKVSLPSALQNIMTIPQSHVIMQFYEEFKWILFYLKESLSPSEEKKVLDEKRELYIKHLKNKLREEDLLCIALLLAMEFDLALSNGIDYYINKELVNKLQKDFFNLGVKYKSELDEAPHFAVKAISLEDDNELIQQFITSYQKVVDDVERISPKLYKDISGLRNIRNDLYHFTFFNKLIQNMNLGCIKRTLIIEGNIDYKYVEGKIKKIALKDFSQVYDEIKSMYPNGSECFNNGNPKK
ncbi:hypothetical protein ACNQFZ_13085 [Schinkia sp. CFF1]